MINSKKQNRSKLRWVGLSILLFAFIVLPVGMAFGHDFQAVERRLAQAVADGEITFEQAAEMIEVLRESDDDEDDDEDVIAELKEEMEEFGDKLKSAVKNGRISEKDAWERWNHFLDNEIAQELKEEVEEGEISEKEAIKFWKEIKGKDGDDHKCKGKHDDDDDDDDDDKLEGHYKKLGVSEEMFDGIENRLAAIGIKGEKIEKVMGGMLRLIYGAKKKGKHGEINERIGHYFRKDLGLNEKQIEAVLQLTRRVAHSQKDTDHKRGDHRGDERMAKYKAIEARIHAVVKAGKMSREDAGKKLAAIRKEIWADKKTDKPCDVRTGASKKAGSAAKKRPVAGKKVKACDKAKAKECEQKAKTNTNERFKHAWARLESAVKAGKMTKEDAIAKMTAIKKEALKKTKAIGRKAKEKADNFDLEAVGNRIKAAVAAGKMTEKEAWEKWEWVKKNELKPRLEAAVKAGKMTRQQVGQVWKEIRKAEFGEKLKSAVAKGRITEKQARAKWQEYEKKNNKAKPAKK